MEQTVFFAWQLDLPLEDNKKAIWTALKSACEIQSLSPEQSPRPDKDTEGVSGTPNIISTIFEKIASCSVFVADVSFIGQSDKGKYLSNPNVLIELGFAAKSIGWDRTVLVFNESSGKVKDLPFDLRQHRFPIEYKLTAETQNKERRIEKLAESLKVAIDNCTQTILNRAVEMYRRLDIQTLIFVAEHQYDTFIDMRVPGETLADRQIGEISAAAIRRLIDLGAIEVVLEESVGYRWTYDGQQMILEIMEVCPILFHAVLGHKIG